MTTTLVLLAVMVLGSAHSGAAQARPDFSGRWTTEPAPAAPTPAPEAPAAGAPPRGRGPGRSGDMGSGWGSPITITQEGTRLTVEYAFFARGDLQPPLRFAYALDGSETRNSVMMGRGIQMQVSKAAWAGDTLVITTTHTLVDPASGKPAIAIVMQTLSLESPASLVVDTTRSGVLGGPATTSRTAYRKIS